MALAARNVGSVRVPATGTREPSPHGCLPAILVRSPTGISLQIRDQPLPLLLGELADLVEDFFQR
jgi:hypothetical protein